MTGRQPRPSVGPPLADHGAPPPTTAARPSWRHLSSNVRMLLVSELAFNIGFFMVLPFLAVHLWQDLALAGWLVGLVLGVRTFSQQGLFLLGGAVVDRFVVRPCC